jgi:hypothetical protein
MKILSSVSPDFTSPAVTGVAIGRLYRADREKIFKNFAVRHDLTASCRAIEMQSVPAASENRSRKSITQLGDGFSRFLN